MLKKLPPFVIACGILFVLVIVYFAKGLFFSPGTFIGGMDVAGSFYWNEAFVKESFLSGSIPLWNPYYYSGHPFLANPSVFAFYPATLLYVFLPLPLAFNLDTVLHIFIAAVGMFLLVNIITNSVRAGIASALVYSLSGYFIERIIAGHIPLIHAAALVPLIFYFTENALKTNKTRNLSIAGLFLGLQVLGGDPHVSYLSSLFVTLYYFIRVVSDSGSAPLSDRMKKLGFFLLIPLVAFGVSAIQILPSLEFSSLSDRANNTFEFVSEGSFSKAHFYSLLIPQRFNKALSSGLDFEMGCYIGMLSLFLAFVGLFFSRYRKHTICIGIMLIVTITFILGKNTPLYRLYYELLPMLSSFRVPARATFVFDFLMAVLAGLGIKHLIEHSLDRMQFQLVVTVIAVLLAFLLLGALNMHIPLSSRCMANAVLLFICSLVLLSLSVFLKNKQLISWSFIAVIFIDSYWVYSSSIPALNEEALLQNKPFEQTFERDAGFYRVMVPGYDLNIYGLPSRGMRFHYFGTNGSTPIVLKEYFDFIYNMAMVPPPSLNRHTFSQDLFVNSGLPFSSRILGVKYAVLGDPSNYQLMQIDWCMPRAALIHNAVVLPRLEDHLAYLKDPRFDPIKTILLEKGANALTLNSLSKDISYAGETVRIENYKPNRIDLKSRSQGDAYLLLSELWYPGWKAYVDGKEVDILKADYLLRAINLPAGEHSVSFVYRPMSFYAGLVLTICTLFTLLILACTYYRRNAGIE